MMAGLGLSLVPFTPSPPAGRQGMAGLSTALMYPSRLFGGALGLAIFATIAADHTHGADANAITHGYSVGFGVSAAVCLAGAIVAATALRAASGEAN